MQGQRARDLFGGWAELARAPFTGITTGDHVVPGLFPLLPADAPTPAMIAAVSALLGAVSPAQRSPPIALETLAPRCWFLKCVAGVA